MGKRSSRWLLAAVWLMLAVCRSVSGAPEDIWEDAIKEGLAAVKRQDLTAAARAFEKAVRDGKYIDSDRHVVSLNFLGEVYLRLGEFAKSERVLREALRLVDNIPGLTDQERASTTNNLAAVLDAQGRFRDAEGLYHRALELLLKSPSAQGREIYVLASNLAGVEERLGDVREAEWLYRYAAGDTGGTGEGAAGAAATQRLLQKARRGTPATETRVAALNNLGVLLVRDGRLEEAEPVLSQAQTLAAANAMLLEAAFAAHNRGLLQDRLRQHDAAGVNLERAYSTRRDVLGDTHPDVASTRYALAQHLALRGDMAAALEHARAASAVLERRVGSSTAFAGLSAAAKIATTRQWRDAFEAHLTILQQAGDKAGADRINEAFRLIQLARASETAMAVAGSVERHAQQDAKLADALRRQQDGLVQRQEAEHRLAAALAQPPGERDRNALAAIRLEAERADRFLDEAARQLSARTTAEGMTVTLRQAQLALRPGEALLVYLLGAQSTHLAVVTSAESGLVPLSAASSEIARTVRRLRKHLDAAEIGTAAPYPVDDAHRLYLQLLGPAEALLKGVREIVVVGDGELETLPFAVLLRQAVAAPRGADALRGFPWLIRDYALTSLPSADALVRLRSLARSQRTQEPFIAFADPLLQGSGAERRGDALRQAVARADDVKQLAALPETAGEVAAIGKLLGATSASLYLRDRATESQVKSLALERYRVVMFATHGVVSGDIPGIVEPALILSPPTQGSAQDDGVLTASEIRRLNLDADWVILSACNTAAGDGTPGSEGYSGLARAFFYAGARSLLVSHWPVVSAAAVELTTRMFEALRSDGAPLSRAEALRRSMLEMIDRPTQPEFTHPLYWAPFVLVGDSLP